MAESNGRGSYPGSSGRSRGARGSAGPAASGRTGSPSSRTAQRSRTQSTARRRPDVEASPVVSLPKPRVGFRNTQRMIVVVVTVALFVLLYGGTFNAYFHQRTQIAQTKQQIQESKENIAELESEIERWKDPEYVKTQARERLGWVIPGETGYRVVGPDGEPYGGGQQIGSGSLPAGEYGDVWWDHLWGSMQTADDPEPKKEEKAPITVEETPAPDEAPVESETPSNGG